MALSISCGGYERNMCKDRIKPLDSAHRLRAKGWYLHNLNDRNASYKPIIKW